MNYNSFIAPCPLGNITLSQDQRRHRHLPQTQLPPLPSPEESLVQTWGILQGKILTLLFPFQLNQYLTPRASYFPSVNLALVR